MRIISVIIALVAMAFFAGIQYEKAGHEPVVVEVPSEPVIKYAKPDTVEKIVKSVEVVTVRDTIIQTEVGWQTVRDTIVVYKDKEFYASSKLFDSRYFSSQVGALGASPVYEFSNKTSIKWDAINQDVYAPRINSARRSGRNKGFMLGLASGIVLTSGIVWAVN